MKKQSAEPSWLEARPNLRDRGGKTFLPINLLAERTHEPEEDLRRLLEAGKIDGLRVDGGWISTVDAVNRYRTESWTETFARIELQPFTVRPRYSRAGDCLFMYFYETESWADRVDEFFTVYRAFADDSIIGFKLKNVHHLAKELGDYWVHVQTENFLVHLFILRLMTVTVRPQVGDETLAKYHEAAKAAEHIATPLPPLPPVRPHAPV